MAVNESTPYSGLRELRPIVERVEALLEERLVGIDEPSLGEARAIEEYEEDKRRGKVELVGLGGGSRGAGVASYAMPPQGRAPG